MGHIAGAGHEVTHAAAALERLYWLGSAATKEHTGFVKHPELAKVSPASAGSLEIALLLFSLFELFKSIGKSKSTEGRAAFWPVKRLVEVQQMGRASKKIPRGFQAEGGGAPAASAACVASAGGGSSGAGAKLPQQTK